MNNHDNGHRVECVCELCRATGKRGGILGGGSIYDDALAALPNFAEVAARGTILKETTRMCEAAGFTPGQIAGVRALVKQCLKQETT